MKPDAVRHLRAFWVLVAVGAAVLTSCGGSSSTASSPTTPSSISKSAEPISSRDVFIASANSICSQGAAAIPPAPGDPSHATTAQLPTWSAYLQTTVMTSQNVLAGLKALSVPPGDAAAVNTVLATEQISIQDAQAAQQAAAQNDLPGFQTAVAKFKADDATAINTAKAYGLDACANA